MVSEPSDFEFTDETLPGCCGYVELPLEDELTADHDSDNGHLSKISTSARWLTDSHYFKNFIFCSIVASLVSFVVQTEYMALSWRVHPPLLFNVIELVFLMIFTIEIALRINRFRLGFFLGHHHCTNWFDFFLVILQGSELFVHIVSSHSTGFISGLRILRVSRILRIGRVLHLVPALRMLFVSILSSMESLMWISIFVFLSTTCFAVVLTQIVTDYKASVGRDEIENHQPELQDNFGSVGVSTFRLYQTISDGRHWGELAEPLMSYCSPWTASLFIAYSAFVTFALMNVVTAFFVETALKEAQEDNQKHMATQLWELFHSVGFSQDTEVSEEEFMSRIDDPAMLAYLKQLDLDSQKAKEMRLFKLIDKDRSGSVNSRELLNGCLKLMGNAKAVEVAALLREQREECYKNEKYRKQVVRTMDWLRKHLLVQSRQDVLEHPVSSLAVGESCRSMSVEKSCGSMSTKD
jgi:hypothetical protein